jgi:hypothetical protein
LAGERSCALRSDQRRSDRRAQVALFADPSPGDAKALVQELIKLYPTKPDRIHVFKVLYATCKSVVEQLKSAQETEMARKAG